MAGPVRTVIGGVDTHKDAHVVAALGEQGALLGTASFPTNLAGYGQLPAWLRDFGAVTSVGIEGTGSALSPPQALLALGVRLAEHLRIKVVPGRDKRWVRLEDLDNSIIRCLGQPLLSPYAILQPNRLKLRHDPPIQGFFP